MNESVRKHVSQMTEAEKNELLKIARRVDRWRLTKHIDERMDERGMTDYKDIKGVLREGSIIEFHVRNGSPRILVRGEKTFYDYVPCVVFDLRSKAVVTLYWNRKNDYHRTIDMSLYNEDLDVFAHLI